MPYGLPVLFVEAILARYSEGAKLLSSKLETTIDPVNDQKVRELDYTKLNDCTLDYVVIEQYIRAGGNVVAGMIRAHTSLQELRDAPPMMATHEYDQIRNRLLYDQCQFEGLDLLASSLEARIRNSASLVCSLVTSS